MENPNPQRGELFLKAYIKASLSALLYIGVRSPETIDKFVAHFQEQLDKNIAGLLEFAPQVQEVRTPESAASTDIDDIRVLGLHYFVMKPLRDAGINTIGQLLTTMQQRSLAEFKGIGKEREEKIREAVSKWNS